MLTESKLKEKSRMHKTKDNERDGVGWASPEPTTNAMDPSTNVTFGKEVWESKDERIPRFLVI